MPVDGSTARIGKPGGDPQLVSIYCWLQVLDLVLARPNPKSPSAHSLPGPIDNISEAPGSFYQIGEVYCVINMPGWIKVLPLHSPAIAENTRRRLRLF
jgi:hypothetical protein